MINFNHWRKTMTQDDNDREVMAQAAAAHNRLSREMDGLRNALNEATANVAAKERLIEELKTASATMLHKIETVFKEDHDRLRLALVDEQNRHEGTRHELDQARADLSDLQALFGSIRVSVEQFELQAPVKRRNGKNKPRLSDAARHDVGGDAGGSSKPGLPDKDASASDLSDLPSFLARPE
jgi:DNA repair exonuclease SbcCD ATPase subunit